MEFDFELPGVNDMLVREQLVGKNILISLQSNVMTYDCRLELLVDEPTGSTYLVV